MADRTPADMPCKRDCPDRFPGCYCEKKQEWDVQKRAKKQAIYDAKKKHDMIMGVRNPERVKKGKSR